MIETHLMTETLNFFKRIKKTEDDVSWVGSRSGKFACSWTEFFIKFAHHIYDSDFGQINIATDLVIVFKDNTWLERSNYDGAENWEWYKLPTRKPNCQKFDNISCDEDGSVR